jgi:hypothetical protein
LKTKEVARRVTERQELEVRNLEAADAAAKAQRERTAGSLGVDVDPRYVPSTVRPGDWRGKTGDTGPVVNSDVDPRSAPSNVRTADRPPYTPGQPYNRPVERSYTPNAQTEPAVPTEQRVPGQLNRATPVYPTNKG